MSEYWKSTPKYWCKHCATYVKDTPFERRQHESTAKHQGNLKRFLRGIQNDHEKDQREKDKAKAEVERLNKVVGGSSSVTPASSTSKAPVTRKAASSAPTAADQKRQWGQLAEMGIQVPDTFHRDMAMAGEWQTISEQKIEDPGSEEGIVKGVRKRKYEGQEEEEEAGSIIARRGWGSTVKRYPGQNTTDLETLLSGPILARDKATKAEPSEDVLQAKDVAVKSEIPPEVELESEPESQRRREDDQTATSEEKSDVKTETQDVKGQSLSSITSEPTAVPVFKKRKAKGRVS